MHHHHNGAFILGLLFIIIGVITLLDALGIKLPTQYIWPFVFILVGLWLALRSLDHDSKEK